MPYNKDEKSRSRVQSRRREEARMPAPPSPAPSPPKAEVPQPAPPEPRPRKSRRTPSPPPPAEPEFSFKPDLEDAPPPPGRRPGTSDRSWIFTAAVVIVLVFLFVDARQGGSWFWYRLLPRRDVRTLAQQAPATTGASPAVLEREPSALALALGGDTITTIGLEESLAYFDLDDDGFREKTSWISPDDAFLVQDLNGNHRIDNATELMGDGKAGGNAFERMLAQDSNNDLRLDAADPAFARFLLWQDRNSNGKIDARELASLSERGIQSISLGYTIHRKNEALKLPEVREGTYRVAGRKEKGHIFEIVFQVDQENTIWGGSREVSEYVFTLPWLRGSGTVKHLPLAMEGDPELRTLVEELARLRTGPELYGRMDEFLARWAGVGDMDPARMRGAYSARKTAILERFTGKPYTLDGNAASDVHPDSAPYLKKAYVALKGHAFACLAFQTCWRERFPGVQYRFKRGRIDFQRNGRALAGYLARAAMESQAEEVPYLARAVEAVKDDTKVSAADLVPFLPQDRAEAFRNVDALVLSTDEPLG